MYNLQQILREISLFKIYILFIVDMFFKIKVKPLIDLRIITNIKYRGTKEKFLLNTLEFIQEANSFAKSVFHNFTSSRIISSNWRSESISYK